MSETLLPCPFCGSFTILPMGRAGASPGSESRFCYDCGAIGPGAGTTEKAQQRWNLRAAGWISAEERLPEGENVHAEHLVLHGSQCDCYLAKLSGDGAWRDNKGSVLRNVTHWMPLPPLPEAPKIG